MSETPPNSAPVLRNAVGLGPEGCTGNGIGGKGLAAAAVGRVHCDCFDTVLK